MPGSTTRLSLYKPGGGSSGAYGADEPADIDRLNENFDKLDAAVGARVVTSITRPSSPYDGQIIKETDTGRAKVWRAGTGEWDDLSGAGSSGSNLPTGTTAQRDSLWPTPSTAAGRVALAAQAPLFFNTEKGYIEQYFAAKADAGADNNLAAAASGWYPVAGRVPQGHCTRSGTAANISNSAYTDLSLDNRWTNKRMVGGLTFVNGWKVPVAGYYEVEAMVRGTLATSTLIAGFGVNTFPSSADVMHGAATTASIQDIMVLGLNAVIELAANDTVKLSAFAQPSSMPWATGGNAHWTIKYRGPVIGA